MQVKFSGQFRVAAQWEHSQRQLRTIATALGPIVELREHQPEKDTFTLQVAPAAEAARPSLEQTIFSQLQPTQLSFKCVGDWELQQEAAQASAKTLAEKLNAATEKLPDYLKAGDPLVVRVNGSHLEIFVNSYESERRGVETLQLLQQSGDIKPAQGSHHGAFSGSPSYDGFIVSVAVDPNSEYGQQKQRMMHG